MRLKVPQKGKKKASEGIIKSF